MVADPRRQLHELIDRLGDDEAAALLADAQRLAEDRPPPHNLPTLHRAPPIASIDDLRGDVFPSDEGVASFDDTVRRWREQGSSRRG